MSLADKIQYYLVGLGIMATGTICQYLVHAGKDDFKSKINFPDIFPELIIMDLTWIIIYVAISMSIMLSWQKVLDLKKKKELLILLILAALADILWIASINILRLFDVATVAAILFFTLLVILFLFIWRINRYYALLIIPCQIMVVFSAILIFLMMIMNPDFTLFSAIFN